MKTKMKTKILSLLLAVCLVAGLVPVSVLQSNASATGTKAIQAGAAQLEGMSADSVYFGTYQQSSDGAGGFNVDPIKWDVLANSDGKLFVVSDQALDYRQVHTTGSNLDWKQKALRGWLNGTAAGNFYADAFAENEKSAVVLTTVTTSGDSNTSDDYVFILSVEEATEYFADKNARVWTVTDYDLSKDDGAYHFDQQWLRNRDTAQGHCGALMVGDGGIVTNAGHHVGYKKQIRPAFNLDTSKVLFTSPAVGGKTGTGLEKVGTYDGNEWKVTLLDSNRSNFTAVIADIDDDTLTVDYTNAVTGTNEFISVIVKDNVSGEYTNYGTVKALANAFDANGTVQVDISGIDLNGKTLYVFNEQRNGDKKTDYASALQEIGWDVVKAIEAGATQLAGMSADSVYFGTYQQSSNEVGGFNVDPIKWDVLANSDGKLFVVSDQALDYRVAHTSGSNLDWKQRTLRAWLNGTTAGNFYADAFAESEKTAVSMTTVTTVGDTNTSDDYVFVLSKEEAITYFADNNARKWTYTDYVKSKEGTVGGHFTHQWLRNRDSSYNWCGVLMTPDGAIVDNAKHHFGYAKQIRPAFNLDVSQVLFTSPAVGGKTGTGIETVRAYDGNEWKVTLLDSNRGMFMASLGRLQDDNIVINYANAKIGANEYVSVIVKDNVTGKYTNYGQVKALSDEEDANGSVNVNIGNLDLTGKTLYVFNEQCNGDKQTDYASPLHAIEMKIAQQVKYTKTEVDELRGVTAPAAPEGYVFSGWYADEVLTTPIKKSDEIPAEGAWAKFVDANVLDVKAQIGIDTTQESTEADIRFLTSVNDLNYSEIGFEIAIGSNSKLFGSNKVYEEVTVTLKNGTKFEKTPYEVYGPSATYFKAYVIRGVPQTNFDTDINVRPYWITLDGTTVFGALETKTILQGIENGGINTDIEGVSVWSAPSTVKVEQNDVDYADKKAATLSYNAVRNEYESRQLYMTASRQVESYDLKVSDLKSEKQFILSKENIDVYNEKFTYVSDTSYGYAEGYYPDALVPIDAAKQAGELVIEKNKNAGLWITIYIPKGTPAGTYTGVFQLTVDAQSIDIPVSVNVNDYTLTDETTANTLFSWRYQSTGVGELDSSIEMMEEYYEFFLDYRISLQSLPMETLSGKEIVACLEKYYDRLSTYCIGNAVGNISTGLPNASNKAIFREQVFAIAAICTPEKNYLDKAMLYVIDEPDLENTPMTKAYMFDNYNTMKTWLSEIANEIENDTTGKYNGLKSIDNWRSYVEDMRNIVPLSSWDMVGYPEKENSKRAWETFNCICPHWHHLTEEVLEYLYDYTTEYDTDLWWYGSLQPEAPGANYHIANTNLLSARTITWLQKKLNVQGNLYWNAVSYSQEGVAEDKGEFTDMYTNPYQDPGMPAGDGKLTYPGASYGLYGPLPSIRLMSIRDGNEEYELLADVENAYNAMTEAGKISTSVDELMEPFYSALSVGTQIMYADGENGLDFDKIRASLIDAATSVGKGADTVSDRNKVERVSTNQYSVTENQNLIVEKNDTEMQLLTFETYQNITGAKLYMGEQFGRMAVNQDETYITQGTGSLLVRPQGDYGNAKCIPTLRFKCLDSEIATSDFSEFSKVTLDVYNNTDKELHVRMYLTAMHKNQETYMSTPSVTFTLTPNAWTECIYDLSTEIYLMGMYDLSSIQYIYLEFPEAKTSKTDVVNELYVDNLKGHYYDKEPEAITYTPDFWGEGVTFENALDQHFVRKMSDKVDHRFELSRVSYAEEGMNVDSALGEYGMKGIAEKALWADFIVDYFENVPRNSILSFMAYVQQTPDNNQTYRVEAGNASVGAAYPYNEWFEVKIKLNQDVSASQIYFNFDGSILGGSADYMFGDKPTIIYMDNFKLTEGSDTYQVKNGTLTINNDIGAQDLQYNIQTSMKEGEKYKFDLDFVGQGGFTLWFKANGQWNSATDKNNEFIATTYSTWEGKQTVEFTALKDVEYIQIRLKYNEVGKTSTLTLTNWKKWYVLYGNLAWWTDWNPW